MTRWRDTLDDTAWQAAKWCRWAECYLRTLWQRGQVDE